MQFLAHQGYCSLGLSDALTVARTSGSEQTKPVVITFDDGYLDFYTDAFPLLDQYGFTATVFLPTAFIGSEPQPFNGMDCLTWDQVRELKACGVEFGAHTVTHPQLRTMQRAAIEQEILCSKCRIEDELQSPVRSFAYPYAFPEADRPFRQLLRRILEQSGYEHGVSTIIGTADETDDPFFMPRLPINSWDDRQLFRAKLEGGYDWLHAPQYLRKALFQGPPGLRARRPDDSC